MIVIIKGHYIDMSKVVAIKDESDMQEITLCFISGHSIVLNYKANEHVLMKDHIESLFDLFRDGRSFVDLDKKK